MQTILFASQTMVVGEVIPEVKHSEDRNYAT